MPHARLINDVIQSIVAKAAADVKNDCRNSWLSSRAFQIHREVERHVDANPSAEIVALSEEIDELKRSRNDLEYYGEDTSRLETHLADKLEVYGQLVEAQRQTFLSRILPKYSDEFEEQWPWGYSSHIERLIDEQLRTVPAELLLNKLIEAYPGIEASDTLLRAFLSPLLSQYLRETMRPIPDVQTPDPEKSPILFRDIPFDPDQGAPYIAAQEQAYQRFLAERKSQAKPTSLPSDVIAQQSADRRASDIKPPVARTEVPLPEKDRLMNDILAPPGDLEETTQATLKKYLQQLETAELKKIATLKQRFSIAVLNKELEPYLAYKARLQPCSVSLNHTLFQAWFNALQDTDTTRLASLKALFNAPIPQTEGEKRDDLLKLQLDLLTELPVADKQALFNFVQSLSGFIQNTAWNNVDPAFANKIKLLLVSHTDITDLFIKDQGALNTMLSLVNKHHKDQYGQQRCVELINYLQKHGKQVSLEPKLLPQLLSLTLEKGQSPVGNYLPTPEQLLILNTKPQDMQEKFWKLLNLLQPYTQEQFNPCFKRLEKSTSTTLLDQLIVRMNPMPIETRQAALRWPIESDTFKRIESTVQHVLPLQDKKGILEQLNQILNENPFYSDKLELFQQLVKQNRFDLRSLTAHLNDSTLLETYQTAKELSRDPNTFNDLFSTMAKPAMQQTRRQLMRCLHHELFNLGEEFKAKCYHEYHTLANSISHQFSADRVQKVNPSERVGLFNEWFQKVIAFTKEIRSIIKPPAHEDNKHQQPPTNATNATTDQHRKIFEAYKQQYASQRWVNSERKKQADTLFKKIGHIQDKSLDSATYYTNTLDAICQAQKDILDSDKGTTRNKKGYSRLYDITQSMFLVTAQDCLKDPSISLEQKAHITNLLTNQIELNLQLLQERLPQHHPLKSSLALTDLKSISLEKNDVPSHLRYLVDNINFLMDISTMEPGQERQDYTL